MKKKFNLHNIYQHLLAMLTKCSFAHGNILCWADMEWKIKRLSVPQQVMSKSSSRQNMQGQETSIF